jgi:nucleotide-binding universal stress UspA family protein
MYTVLVPNDFTEAAEYAMEHAAKVVKIFNGEVHMLHVIAKEKDRDKAQAKLDEMGAEASAKYGVTYKSIVRKGNIFDDIGIVAGEVGARLIIMGTHGVKGIQKLVGSYALKVILHSEVPFIITQKKSPNDKGYKDIVVPISYEEESKQKLTLISKISEHFGAKLHVFCPYETDSFLVARLKRQLSFTKKFLDEKKVPYDVKIAKEKGNFIGQVTAFAHSVEADLIAVVNTADKGVLPDFIAGSSGEQDLITNSEQIPAIIMNPSQKFVAESFGG